MCKAIDVTFTVDTHSIINPYFLGMGVQWDPADHRLPDFNEQQWEMIYKRVDFMQTKFARVMLGAGFYVHGFDDHNHPQYCWDSIEMQRLYKILDYCQGRGVSVMIGEWNKPHWADTYDDPRWIGAIGDFLNHMRYVKGYTCLKYYNYVNEPNGDWMMPGTTPEQRWEYWDRGIRAMHQELTQRGFLDWISLCGPDSAYDDEWVDRCVDTMPQIMGQYEFHIYKDYDREVMERSIEKLISEKRRYIMENDPEAANKHFWLGELGLKEHCDFEHDCQNRVYDFDYGVLMQDEVIQGIRGGIAGIIPWDLDDAMHYGGGDSASRGQLKRWGMWNTLGGTTLGQIHYPLEDTDLRPWYYPMALSSRLFPQGCETIVLSEAGAENLRAAAAKIANDSGWDLSFAVVNEQDTAQTVKLVVPGVCGEARLAEYHYFEQDRPVGSEGFPRIKEFLEQADLEQGIEIDLPARGVVFLSSIGTGSVIGLEE